MILITSCITIALVYYFQETGVPYAFFVALFMEVGFILYIFNYLKEMEGNYDLKNENERKAFQKSEAKFQEELESLKAELEKTKGELSSLNKKRMEQEMMDIIRKQKAEPPEKEEP